MDSLHHYLFWLIIIFCTTFSILIQENQIIQAHKIATNYHHQHYGSPTNVTKTLYFPNFTPITTTTQPLKLLGNARVSNQNGVVQIPYASSQTVDLTYQVGRAIYSSPIRLFDPLTNTPASFQTTFSFQLSSTDAGPATHSSGGGGLAFVIVPDEFTVGRPGPWLGILNDACNHYKAFAVEFDASHDPELGDPNDNHVGINAGSAVSFKTTILPSSDARVSLHDDSVHRAWIFYDEKSEWIDVFLGLDGDPVPQKPILSSPLNLSPFLQEYMFVGFSASTGNSSEFHNIFSWNFSSVSRAFVWPRTTKICHRNLARQVSKYSANYGMKTYYDPPSSFMVFLAVLGLFSLVSFSLYCNSQPRMMSSMLTSSTTSAHTNVFLENKRRPRPPSQPRRFSLLELCQATRRFSQVEVLASDPRGVLYRGTLRNGCRLGVKRFRSSDVQQYHSLSWSRLEYGGRVLKRIGELTQVSHPSLAPIRGWCFDSAEAIVVYDYYVNGSVEKWLFGLGAIPWTRRVKLIKDVGEALSYFHSKELVHGNVNTSSVFLDLNYGAVLGDYGFVFSRGRDRSSSSSTVMMKKQDVFEFGMLVLEFVAGKKAVDFDRGSGGDINQDHHEMGLLEFALRMKEREEMVKVVDERVLMGIDCADAEEAVRFVEIGLSCCTGESHRRPSMDDVVQLLNKKI
ncbi:Tyrosine-protein kinase [Trema orientale]|uniref:Tyrosine-protein kinase n=1 Tax=Trema orientale TaxID=63057 RepID=A0A2P5CSN0_TREOI|nr:Tyrosine-protein kinase [Trema orientale]